MKKVFALLSLIVFVAAVTAVFATDPNRDVQDQPKVNCCHPDGKCEKIGKQDCAIKKGKEVSDCKDCPGVWGEGKGK